MLPLLAAAAPALTGALEGSSLLSGATSLIGALAPSGITDMFGGSGLDSSSATTGPQTTYNYVDFGGAQKNPPLVDLKIIGWACVAGGCVYLIRERTNG